MNWLQSLPLKEGCPPVRLHSGALKNRQDVHVAVVDIDVGKRDLQQCADAIIRLRAEYLFSKGQYDAIQFHFVNGELAAFASWTQGLRLVPQGAAYRWERRAQPGSDYPTFREYLNAVFMYAGTLSLSREMTTVSNVAEMCIGDVFVQGGSPGHAVIVVDIALNFQTGKKVFLLAQSYMPAQDVHILRNPGDDSLSPWYALDFGAALETPEWSFARKNLNRFPSPLPSGT